ncbi:hypothetical protein NP493_555g01065 [Ridgeia piscesae]|uniref:Uncharacterized protein n=1 Tax=Ridgeia piscesae TaxID=27915 RepID=A0AAD9KVA8_RIDPI|nr:hypothetical protein NP493_555g01065 [Ridgeia piscesae]
MQADDMMVRHDSERRGSGGGPAGSSSDDSDYADGRSGSGSGDRDDDYWNGRTTRWQHTPLASIAIATFVSLLLARVNALTG